jgi:endoglucanase
MGTYPSGVKYRGINRSGAENPAEWDGWKSKQTVDWFEVPEGARLTQELTYYASKGFNAIRFPIAWERVQHTLQGELDDTAKPDGTPGYAQQVTTYVTQATAAGFLVIVDLHNYNRYAVDAFDAAGNPTPVGAFTQHVFGDGTLGVTDLVDVWTRLATRFLGNSRVVFGLMNEPHRFPCDQEQTKADGTPVYLPGTPEHDWCTKYKIPSDIWFACLQQVIYGIRRTGADQLILVPNSHGSDVEHWNSDVWHPLGGPKDSIAALTIQDTSVDNLAFDMHQYRNPAFETYAKQMEEVTTWAKAQTPNRRLFLSEFGVMKTDPNGQDALDSLLDHLDANADVWLGWTPWDDADDDDKHPYTLTVVDPTTLDRKDGPQLKAGWYDKHLTPNTV